MTEGTFLGERGPGKGAATRHPLVALVGSPGWGRELEAALRQQAFAPARFDGRANYVTWLADGHAAMVLVDGEADGWERRVYTVKASQATRRIPVVVVAEAASRRKAGLANGADAALGLAPLLTKLPGLLANLARVMAPQERARLARECDQPLPPLAREGVDEFNAGAYYRQHDLFEQLWMDERGPVRDLYRAILQVGVAYYQITRGNHRGALKMLLRSQQWLNVLPDVCQGVDVRQLRNDAGRVRAALEAIGPQAIGDFDRDLLKPVRLVQSHH